MPAPSVEFELPPEAFVYKYGAEELRNYISALDERITLAIADAEVGNQVSVVSVLPELDMEVQLSTLQREIEEAAYELNYRQLRERVFILVNVGFPKLYLSMYQVQSNLIRAEIQQNAREMKPLEFLSYMEKTCGLL